MANVPREESFKSCLRIVNFAPTSQDKGGPGDLGFSIQCVDFYIIPVFSLESVLHLWPLSMSPESP
jgi:hypothetical protein